MSQKIEHRSGSAATSSVGLSVASKWVMFFVIALLVPIQIYLGGIRLSFYRVVLLLAIVPIAMRLISTNPIRLRLVDILIILFGLTGAFSLFMTDASVSAVGIFTLESLGPYFLARAFIRNSQQFSAMVRVLTTCIIVTIPFALYENVTRNPIILTVLGKVLPVLPNVPHEQRLGFDRAQVTFDHPILYGVFCALGFALAIYAVRPGPPPRLSILSGALVGFAAFLSLSSGAMVPVGLQGILILYDRILSGFRQRWILLAASFVTIYALVESLSNRSMAQIAIPFLALNPGTAWTRLNVNEWAMSGIMAHPWFGFGFTMTWPTQFWIVTTSIDNFWLALAFRHGLPTMLLLLAAVACLLLSMIFTRQTDPFVNACRTGFVITMVAICVAVITVHFWNSVYCAFLFLLGSGAWMTEEQVESSDNTTKTDPPFSARQTVRYSRNFPAAYHR
ncbi:MAG: hypothetical protein WBB25_19265 [Sulfitobacter sp.]